jgi:hypothetical protein
MRHPKWKPIIVNNRFSDLKGRRLHRTRCEQAYAGLSKTRTLPGEFGDYNVRTARKQT